MSLAESARAPLPARSEPRFRLAPLVLVAWAAAAAALLIGGPGVRDYMSADDLMRLSEVRDFLAGQSWFDVSQYRLDPPAGSSMHWSRIIDLPIALLISIFSPLIGRAHAEIVTSALWPMLLLIPSLALAALLAKRLANAAAIVPAVLLTVVSAPALVHFRPGALDHHGPQLLLMLTTLYGVTARGDARLAPALGGFAAAVSLAIGLEMAPVLAAVLAAIGLRWVIEGNRVASLTSAFGIAFGVGTAALFAATVRPSDWGAVHCDFVSLPCIAAAGLSGGTLALLAKFGDRLATPYARFAAGSIAGLAVIVSVFIPFQSCLGDPYEATDPRVAAIWLSHVAETQNAFEFAQNFPSQWLTFYAAPLAALVLGVAAMLKQPSEKRIVFIAPLFALFAFDAIALWELRGAYGASLIAQPILAASLVLLFGVGASLVAHRAVVFALMLISTPVLTAVGSGIGAALHWLNPARVSASDGGDLFCRRSTDMARLAELKPGLVVSYIDIGPSILADTKHTVLAAPYHRNSPGNATAYDILLMTDDAEARRLIKEHEVRYIAICTGAPEREYMGAAAPKGLSERLARGEVPPYLEPIPDDAAAPLRVFRVR